MTPEEGDMIINDHRRHEGIDTVIIVLIEEEGVNVRDGNWHAVTLHKDGSHHHVSLKESLVEGWYYSSQPWRTIVKNPSRE